MYTTKIINKVLSVQLYYLFIISGRKYGSTVVHTFVQATYPNEGTVYVVVVVLYCMCYDLASYVLHVLPYQLIRRTAATVILISRGSEETNRCSRGSVFPFKTLFLFTSAQSSYVCCLI